MVKPEVENTTYIVSGTETVVLTAPESIILRTGTHIMPGAVFTAQVDNSAISSPYVEFDLSDENYVFTRSYQKAMNSAGGIKNNGDVIEQVTYFDGLGRAMQQVGIRASNDERDILTHIGYDDFGRQDKDWLPMEDTGGLYGSYRGDITAETNTFYRNKYPDDISSTVSQQNAYSRKEFEPSPLNRVLKQAAPGYDWRLGGGH